MNDWQAMFLHGLESCGQGHKARWIAARVPGLHRPDFTGALQERMARLQPLLREHQSWALVGSSFGGLMAALWTVEHPHTVERLILLAPALHHPEFEPRDTLATPTLLVHGTRDSIVPAGPVEEKARRKFSDLTVWRVEDEHRLIPTSQAMDWAALLDPARPAPWRGMKAPGCFGLT